MKVFIALCVAALIAVGGYLTMSALGIFDGSFWQAKNRNEIQQELTERSGKLNRKMETMLDQTTRFERTEVDENAMLFIYKLIKQHRRQIDIDKLRADVEPQLREQVCNDDSMAFYREHNIRTKFRYLDSNNEHIMTVAFVAGETCSA